MGKPHCGPRSGSDDRGRRGRGRAGFLGVILGVILGASLCLVCSHKAYSQSPVDEYQLKAAFLFHFAQFVEWPSRVSENSDGTFLFCIVGEDPFHGDLRRIVEGKLLAAKVIRVQNIKQLQDSQGCRVLFIDKNESKRASLSMTALRKMPVLTVGESEDFLQQGGIIRFFLEDRKVRFEVNQQAAGNANLKVSSRLLLLAKTVVGDSSGK